MIILTINAKLQPTHRYYIEDFIEKYLEKHNLGSVDGGGTALAENGEVEDCDIVIMYSEKKADEIIEFLKDIPLPKGSKISFDEEGNDKEIPVGNLEGLGFYFSNDLEDEVYENCDINVVVEKFDELLEDKHCIFSYCETNKFTAIYYYGQSFAEMSKAIEDFVASYPLCENGKIVELISDDNTSKYDEQNEEASKIDNTVKNELYIAIEKLYDDDKYTDAISLYDNADESLKTADVKSYIAVGYNNAGQYKKAVELLIPLENKTSNELKRLYRLAYAYWQLDEHQECMDTCMKVFELAKTNPELDSNGNVKDCDRFYYDAWGGLNEVTLESELGTFVLDYQSDCLECHIPFDGRSVSVSVDVIVDDSSTWQADIDIAVAFCKEELFDTLPKAKECAADNLLDLANSWCEDDEKITKDVFISRLQLASIDFYDGEEYTLFFNNEEMFADLDVVISGNVNSGVDSAKIM